MKLVFLSDIHANNFYLQTVWSEIQKHAPDYVFCLGDLVAYYDEPGTVINWCRENRVSVLKGNHEKYVLGELEPNSERRALYKVDEHRALLNSEQMEYLRSLPDFLDLELSGRRFYMTHSLPGDAETYLTDPSQLDKAFLAKYDYYCFGHSHHPCLRYHYGTLLINPGSVGQPRDYTTQPSFALLDLEKNNVMLQKVEVDADSYQAELLRKGTNQSMTNILVRSRTSNAR